MQTLTNRVSQRESLGRQPTPRAALRQQPEESKPVLDGAAEKASLFRSLLAAEGSADLRRVGVIIEDGRVVLSGRVSSFYQKQLAQETLRPYLIGIQIDNRIEVQT